MKPKLLIGGALVGSMILLAVGADVFTRSKIRPQWICSRYAGPSAEHLFGLDQNGADVFSQVAHGAQISLRVAFTVVFISALIGLVVGSIAGFLGGWIDQLIMRFLDMFYAFPGFLLALSAGRGAWTIRWQSDLRHVHHGMDGICPPRAWRSLACSATQYVIGALAIGATSSPHRPAHLAKPTRSSCRTNDIRHVRHNHH